MFIQEVAVLHHMSTSTSFSVLVMSDSRLQKKTKIFLFIYCYLRRLWRQKKRSSGQKLYLMQLTRAYKPETTIAFCRLFRGFIFSLCQALFIVLILSSTRFFIIYTIVDFSYIIIKTKENF